jgi:toluene monooxygenase system ferredoxin subunit
MAWKRVCKVSDVPVNGVKKFATGAFPVIVVNYGEGVRVLPPICPHMEEPLEVSGVVANCKMTCTKHLWSWDLRTLQQQGETEKPLQQYESRIVDGVVEAVLENEIVYEFDDADNMDDDDFFSKG